MSAKCDEQKYADHVCEAALTKQFQPEQEIANRDADQDLTMIEHVRFTFDPTM